MQSIKIGKHEYISARKEWKALDCSLRAKEDLKYFYSSFKSNSYAIEEIADAIVGEQSVVLFYIPRTNYLAIVFAYSDKQTKFINLKDTTPLTVNATLKWFCLSASADNEVVIANGVPREYFTDVKHCLIDKNVLLLSSKNSGKMFSASRRNVTRMLILIFVSLGFTGGMFTKHIAEFAENITLEKEKKATEINRNILEVEKIKASLYEALKNENTQKQEDEHFTQSFADDFIALENAPKSIQVKDGRIVQK